MFISIGCNSKLYGSFTVSLFRKKYYMSSLCTIDLQNLLLLRVWRIITYQSWTTTDISPRNKGSLKGSHVSHSQHGCFISKDPKTVYLAIGGKNVEGVSFPRSSFPGAVQEMAPLKIIDWPSLEEKYFIRHHCGSFSLPAVHFGRLEQGVDLYSY